MPINPDSVGASSDPLTERWTPDDCLLYALGVGAGQLDPTGFELELTTEAAADRPQHVLPTFATVVGQGSSPLGGIGDFDRAMVVHGEQSVELSGPLPSAAEIETTNVISAIYDKGTGALVAIDSRSVDAETRVVLFSKQTSVFIRGAGGFGGERGPRGTADRHPDRGPDQVVTYATRPDQALLYRLNGDRNPLHCDPAFAKRAGFDRPILHGLCTFGVTGRALFHEVCGSDPRRFKAQRARFSRPTFPGDTLSTAIWSDGDEVWFETRNQRDEVVLDRGRMSGRPPA